MNGPAMQGLGVGRDVPQLSPEAFQALVTSLGATPAPRTVATEAGAGLTSGEEAPTARPANVPRASIEIHNLLKGYADRNGATEATGQ